MRVAVIVVVPAPVLVADPSEPMTATEMFEELQFTWLVRFRVEPSLNPPLAANCCECPVLMVALAGETFMDVSVALVTVSDAVPTCPPKSAEMVVVPAATPETVPLLPLALLTVATDGEDEVQVATAVNPSVSPLVKIPFAVKTVLISLGTAATVGLTWIEASAAPSTTRFAVAVTEPDCTVMIAIPDD